MFYGRPAYRDVSQTAPVRDIGLFPVCFVFEPGALFANAKRVFPFDTGPSQKGLYEPDVLAVDALTKYEVTASIESARRIVRCFFDVDAECYLNQPRTEMLCVFSAELRKSKAVTLCDPVMPVFDGLGR